MLSGAAAPDNIDILLIGFIHVYLVPAKIQIYLTNTIMENGKCKSLLSLHITIQDYEVFYGLATDFKYALEID